MLFLHNCQMERAIRGLLQQIIQESFEAHPYCSADPL